LYHNAQGTAEENIPNGPFAVQIVGESGDVLSSVSFTPSFSILDVPGSVLTRSPFGFKLLYPPNAVPVRITKGQTVLAAESISYGLLLTAVQGVQDGAFVTNPTTRRGALLNMVNALDHQIAIGNFKGAHQFLSNEIRPQMASWLSDSYEAPNPLFYTKSSTLQLVDDLIQRMSQ
jgi:hypothetical protein